MHVGAVSLILDECDITRPSFVHAIHTRQQIYGFFTPGLRKCPEFWFASGKRAEMFGLVGWLSPRTCQCVVNTRCQESLPSTFIRP